MNQIIAPVEKNDDSPIAVTRLDPRQVASRNALLTGKVQHGVIRQHAGKGKTFDYIPHTEGTQTMLDAFGRLWDWEVLNHDVFADGSAVAYGRMTLFYYDPEGVLVHKQSIQEVGAREPITNKEGKIVSPTAFTVLGAASRSLLRCMMRAFGYGLELYREEDQEFTVEQALKVLEDYAKTRGFKKENRDVWTSAMKEAGINRENLIDRFQEAYTLVYATAKTWHEKRREEAEAVAEEKRKSQELKRKLAEAHKEERQPEPA